MFNFYNYKYSKFVKKGLKDLIEENQRLKEIIKKFEKDKIKKVESLE